jgi:hypothetical protein
MPKENITITRSELYEQIWEKPMTKVAAQYGLSDVGLAKICRNLNIPRPPRAYITEVAQREKSVYVINGVQKVIRNR